MERYISVLNDIYAAIGLNLVCVRKIMENEFTILVAEDNLGHFLLTKKFLQKSGISKKEVIHLSDGQVAHDFLVDNCSECDHANYLLLLDIRMPKIDGIEILEWMKGDPNLVNIPVIIVSTSDNPVNVSRCNELGCDSYIVKPLNPSFKGEIDEVVHHAFAECA
jgi:CheY-like chemotaxis protein